MNFKQIRRRIANFDDKAFTSHVYGIANEYGLIVIVYADNEQEALDAAADSGKLDSEQMSEADYNEYSDNGWEDSFICLGNASDPFWCNYLSIHQIK